MKKVMFIFGLVTGIVSVTALIAGLIKLGFLKKTYPFKKKPAPDDEVYSAEYQ